MSYFKHNIPFHPDREFGSVVHTLSKIHGFPDGPCYMQMSMYGEVVVYAHNGDKILTWTPTYSHLDPEPPTERKLLEQFFWTLDKAFGEYRTQQDLANGKLKVCL